MYPINTVQVAVQDREGRNNPPRIRLTKADHGTMDTLSTELSHPSSQTAIYEVRNLNDMPTKPIQFTQKILYTIRPLLSDKTRYAAADVPVTNEKANAHWANVFMTPMKTITTCPAVLKLQWLVNKRPTSPPTWYMHYKFLGIT